MFSLSFLLLYLFAPSSSSEKPISILTSKRKSEEDKFAKSHFYFPSVSCLPLSSLVSFH
jgi:hypothetical protein